AKNVLAPNTLSRIRRTRPRIFSPRAVRHDLSPDYLPTGAVSRERKANAEMGDSIMQPRIAPATNSRNRLTSPAQAARRILSTAILAAGLISAPASAQSIEKDDIATDVTVTQPVLDAVSPAVNADAIKLLGAAPMFTLTSDSRSIRVLSGSGSDFML